MGRAERQGTPHLHGAFRFCKLRGVRAGRQAGAHRQLGQDGAVVGRPERQGTPHLHGALRCGSLRGVLAGRQARADRQRGQHDPYLGSADGPGIVQAHQLHRRHLGGGRSRGPLRCRQRRRRGGPALGGRFRAHCLEAAQRALLRSRFAGQIHGLLQGAATARSPSFRPTSRKSVWPPTCSSTRLPSPAS